jgi:hypothetical protein
MPLRLWSLSLPVLLCAVLTPGKARSQDGGLSPIEVLSVATDHDLEALIVDDQVGTGASNTLGWFYYDELIRRGYVDIHDPGNPHDDTLVDADGSGVPDFHEDLFNLNPARPYIGVAPRCPARPYFHHVRPDGVVIPLREPELLTGPCSDHLTYSPTGGPRRWPRTDTQYPRPRPPGAVVGRALVQHMPLSRQLDIYSDRSSFTKTDTWFSDQGLFPHIPNLLEPKDPKNGNLGLGSLAFLSTDDDDSQCPNSSVAECLQPRLAWSSDGAATVGPVWDLSTRDDGIPDYKASAFDTRGRVIPGKDPNAPITEEDRRVRLGRLEAGREIVFFIVAYAEQLYGPVLGDEATDSCFMTAMWGSRPQCQLWAHGDINVFFSRTFLNLDLHQTQGDLVTSKELRSEWMSGVGYHRLSTNLYGNIQFPQPWWVDIRARNQRAPHALVVAPQARPDLWLMGWEDQNAGGNRTYNDSVILIRKLAVRATTTSLTVSPAPAAAGAPVMLTATVAAEGGVPISGSVIFKANGVYLGPAIIGPGGVARMSRPFPEGTHSITAEYPGSYGAFDSSSSAPVELQVLVGTTTVLSTVPAAAVSGQPVTLTAVVSGQSTSGTPTGEVHFRDGPLPLATVPLDASGLAHFTVPSLSVGNHAVSAEYLPTGAFLASRADVTYAVTRAATEVSLTSDGTPRPVGLPITLTATVRVLAPGAGMPTGDVTFQGVSSDGLALMMGPASVDASGVARLGVTGLPVGDYLVTATYLGDSTFQGATSAGYSQVVTSADTVPSAP